MPESHLRSLRNALERRGWKIVAERPGNDYDISATWEIRRSTKGPVQHIDFEGLDDLQVLPLNRAYACGVRGNEKVGLYFRRPGTRGSPRRTRWTQDLERFINRLSRSP